MADSKISALTAATAVTDDDLAVVVDDPGGTPVTKKITVANLRAALQGLLLTTRGDLMTRDASAVIRKALGASGTVLRSDGTDITWATVATALASLLTTRGDVVVRDNTGVVRLPIGTTGKVLKSDGTDVSWANTKVGEFFIPAGSMTASTTSGCNAPVLVESATNKQNVWLLDFVNAATKNAEIGVQMPSDWDGGTFTVKFAWLVNAAVSTVCRWQVEARSYGDLETLDQAFGTAVAVDDTYGGTANQVAISAATAAVTPSGTPAAGEYMHLRVARLGSHANDTLTQDARLLGVYVTYTRT